MTSGSVKEFPFKYKYDEDFNNIKIIEHCLK